MNAIETRAILAKIKYLNWEPVVGYYNNGAFWMQWTWRESGVERRTQRWYVINTATPDELVEIAWQAVRTAEMQAVQQNFLYRGQPIFSGCDIDALSELYARLRESPKEEKPNG